MCNCTKFNAEFNSNRYGNVADKKDQFAWKVYEDRAAVMGFVYRWLEKKKDGRMQFATKGLPEPDFDSADAEHRYQQYAKVLTAEPAGVQTEYLSHAPALLARRNRLNHY